MKTAKFWFITSQLFSQIWVRITIFSALAVFSSFIALIFHPYIPTSVEIELGAKAIESVLNIIASSMLAVSTFSLGIMANAMASAAQSTTPRATQLLLEDKTSQNVLTTFLGSFVFSLVSIISIQIGAYDNGGRLILLGTTILILVIVFSAFIRWISMLRVFGRIPDTLDRIENAATKSIALWQQDPHLGCHLFEEVPSTNELVDDVFPPEPLHVQHIDLEALNTLAKTNSILMLVTAQPGTFVNAKTPLVRCNKKIENSTKHEICRAFSLANDRTFKQDPELGFIVLAETGSRSLSKALNDPGTAIDIVHRATRLFYQIAENKKNASRSMKTYMLDHSALVSF